MTARSGVLERHPSAAEAARVRLAAQAQTPAHVLQELAGDPAVTVRAAVAMNPAFAPGANLRLLADADARVRALLAGKVARLLPGLSGAAHSAAQAHVEETLLALAGDVAVRVRMTIADAVKSLPEAPRMLILKLAHDPEIAVSDSVVRLSPLLTDEDLLELLATPPHPGLATAVASRARLSAVVADGIAQHADSGAIRALLDNRSAAIQEATLDALIGRAAEHPEWHEPLVRRPALPTRALQALSFIVARNLLDVLVRRTDMPPGLAEDLRGQIATTLDPRPADPTNDEALADVLKRHGEAGVTESLLLNTALAGNHRAVAAMLAVAADVPMQTVDRAITLRSAKALISLTWKAGFSMRAAEVVQALLGRLGPHQTLGAMSADLFPLSVDEMNWQIELLADPVQ